MATVLSRAPASSSSEKNLSMTAVPPYPTSSMSMWPAKRLSNFVIMDYLTKTLHPLDDVT